MEALALFGGLQSHCKAEADRLFVVTLALAGSPFPFSHHVRINRNLRFSTSFI